MATTDLDSSSRESHEGEPQPVSSTTLVQTDGSLGNQREEMVNSTDLQSYILSSYQKLTSCLAVEISDAKLERIVVPPRFIGKEYEGVEFEFSDSQQLKKAVSLPTARPNALVRELDVISPISVYYCVPLWMFIWYPKPMVKMKLEELAQEVWSHDSLKARNIKLSTKHGCLVSNRSTMEVKQELHKEQMSYANFSMIDNTWKERKDEMVKKFDGLSKVVKDVLSDKVEKVIVSDRVEDFPCCLVVRECRWTDNMERIVKAYSSMADSSMAWCISSTKTMELNPEKPMEELRKRADYLKKRVYLGSFYQNFMGLVTKVKEGFDEIVCFTACKGQRMLELDGFEQEVGASRACQLVVKEPREEFVKNFTLPCSRDGSIYKRKYLLGTSMAHLIITKEMVDVAKEVAADVGTYGCMGNRDDQVHSELTLFDLNWELMVLVPWEECELAGREDAFEYAKKDQVSVLKKSVYNRDRNLWHISHGRDILEDLANEPKEDMFMISIELPLAFLLTWLNEIGGNHGIGRVHMDEKVAASVLMKLIMVPLAVKIKFLASLANRVFDGGGMDRAIYMDPPLGAALLTTTPSLECSLYECAVMQRYNMSLVDASWELVNESMVVERKLIMTMKNALAISGGELGKSWRYYLQFDVDRKAEGSAGKKEIYGTKSGANWALQILITPTFNGSTYCSLGWLLVWGPKPWVKMRLGKDEA